MTTSLVNITINKILNLIKNQYLRQYSFKFNKK